MHSIRDLLRKRGFKEKESTRVNCIRPSSDARSPTLMCASLATDVDRRSIRSRLTRVSSDCMKRKATHRRRTHHIERASERTSNINAGIASNETRACQRVSHLVRRGFLSTAPCQVTRARAPRTRNPQYSPLVFGFTRLQRSADRTAYST